MCADLPSVAIEFAHLEPAMVESVKGLMGAVDYTSMVSIMRDHASFENEMMDVTLRSPILAHGYNELW